MLYADKYIIQDMRMPILLIFLLLFITSSSQVIIEGTVTDLKSSLPIPGVHVALSAEKGTVTDASGKYSLSNYPGTYNLLFSFIGYEDHRERVVVTDQEVIKLDIVLREFTGLLDEVVITAGKFEQNLEEVTMSMEVIKPSIINQRNTTSIDQMLQQIPGVTIVDNEPQIRSGSGFSFGAGSRVQILINDIPILSGDAGRPTWNYLPIESLEQIEIIKGASSVLYGSSALSGVINLRTAYPRMQPKTNVTLFGGRYADPSVKEAIWWNEGNSIQSGMSFLHSRQEGNWDIIINGMGISDQGWIGPEPQNPSDSLFDPLGNSRNGFSNRGRIAFNLRKRSKKVEGFSYGIHANFYKSKSTTTLLWLSEDTGLYRPYPGSLTFTDQLAFHIDPFITYYNKKGGKHSLKNRFYSLDNDNTNNQSNFSEVWYSEYQFNQDFDSLDIPDMNGTIGAVYESTIAESELFAGNEGVAGENSSSKFAVYLQLDKKFLNRLSASAGVRYEHFEVNGLNESTTIFRSGINYQLAEATFVRASFGQGFRFPSIAEKFISTRVSSLVIYPNQELLSEKSWNLELGIKQGIKKGNFAGYLDLAFFQQEFDRFIEFTFGQWVLPTIDNFLGLGFKSLNSGQARVQGIEFSVSGVNDFGKIKSSILAGYTFTKPVTLTPDFAMGEFAGNTGQVATYENTSSNPDNNILKYRMQHQIRVDAGLDYDNVFIGISGRYNSFMQNIDKIFEELDTTSIDVLNLGYGLVNWRQNNNKGDFVLDARVGYRITENAKIALIFSNVFNRSYAIRPLAIEAPRLINVQLSVDL